MLTPQGIFPNQSRKLLKIYGEFTNSPFFIFIILIYTHNFVTMVTVINMAKKQVSETIKQQRKARKDFLELKKMQNGEIDAGPKPSEVAIVPKTFKEKLEHLWFYHGVTIISLLLTTVVLAVLVTQCASRRKYDLKVVIYTSNYIDVENNDYISKYLAKHIDDINGDGNADIQVLNCSYTANDKDAQYEYNMTTKIQAIIAGEADALLFITDEITHEKLTNISEEIFDSEPVKLDKEFYKNCDKATYTRLPEGLTISCRAIEGTTLEHNKNVKTFYKESRKIMDSLNK